MRNGVLWVDTGRACFGLVVRDWVITETAPYAWRELGKLGAAVEGQLRARGYRVLRMYG